MNFSFKLQWHAPVHWSAPARYAALLLLICAVCLGAIGWQCWQARQQQLHEADLSTANLARAIAQNGQDSFDKASLILGVIVGELETDGTGSAAMARNRARLALGVSELPFLRNLILIDEHGQRQLAARAMPGQSLDHSGREYVTFHRADPSRVAHVGMPVRAFSGNAWIITISRRINHPDGRFAGVAMASIEVDFFQHYFDEFNLGGNGQILLAAIDGTVIARRPFLDRLVGKRTKGSALFPAYIPRLQSGNARLVSSVDGSQRIFAFRQMEKYPLAVVVSFDQDDVLVDWRLDTLQYLVAALVLLAGMGLQGWRLGLQARLRARSDRMLRSISDSLPMLLSYLDTEQRHSFVNRAYETWTGRPQAQIIGLTVAELIGPVAYAKSRQSMAAAFQGKVSVLQYRSNAYGPERDLHIEYLPQLDMHGKVEGVVTVVSDVSQYQAIQRALLQSQELLKQAQAMVHLGSWEYDMHSDIFIWSDEMYHIFGLEPDCPLLLDCDFWINLVHPDDRASVITPSSVGLAQDGRYEQQYRTVRPDGELRYLLERAETRCNAGGQPNKLIGALIDITERTLAEQAVAAARQRELAIGYDIQKTLLMADVPPELSGAWINTYVEPSQGLHGDFVAVSQHSPTRFNVLVGDVMGKGIHAAMIGAGVKNAYYQVLAELLAQAIDTRKLPGAAAIVNALHQKMTPKLIDMNCFVTLALYAFDAEAGTVTVVNAGHTEGLLARAGGTGVERIGGYNVPIGVLASEVYQEQVLSVTADDQLVLYSDGISEACSGNGEEFGADGIAAWLRQSCAAALPAAAALQQLRQRLAGFGGRVDDKTVIMIRLRPVRQAPRKTVAERSNPDYLTLPFDLDGLPALRQHIEQASAHWPREDAEALLLAVFEAATNAIRHTPAPGPHACLACSITAADNALVFDMVYSGVPVVVDEDTQPDFSGASSGGFGLYIMRHLVDRIEYGVPLEGMVSVRLFKQAAVDDKPSPAACAP